MAKFHPEECATPTKIDGMGPFKAELKHPEEGATHVIIQ